MLGQLREQSIRFRRGLKILSTFIEYGNARAAKYPSWPCFLLGCLIFSLIVLSGTGFAQAAAPQGKIAFIRNGDVWIMNADGSGQRQLTSDGKSEDISWSPDGSKIVFIRIVETPRV